MKPSASPAWPIRPIEVSAGMRLLRAASEALQGRASRSAAVRLVASTPQSGSMRKRSPNAAPNSAISAMEAPR